MQEKQRYIVHTRWGVFSLSEECYQDYLKGNLWICWEPDQNSKKLKSETSQTVNISQEAIHLRDAAGRLGLLCVLKEAGLFVIPVTPYKSKMKDTSIEELNLHTRANNCLMRSGVFTLGALNEKLITDGALASIRNLGAKSYQEIRDNFIIACYALLSVNERAAYFQELLDKRKENQNYNV